MGSGLVSAIQLGISRVKFSFDLAGMPFTEPSAVAPDARGYFIKRQ
jgi:hypothetical protein